MNASRNVIVKKSEIVLALKRHLPCVEGEAAPVHEDFDRYAGLLCEGREMVTLDRLLLNAYVNAPIGFLPGGG